MIIWNQKRVNFFYGLLFVALGLFLIVYQWNYLHYGVDVTDEAFWCAEPYLIAQGAIPVVDNWSQTPLSQILIAPLVKLYIDFSGGTSGIILFMNQAGFVFRFFICSIIFIILKKHIGSFSGACYALLLFAACIGGRTVNYSSLSLYLLCLAGTMIFDSVQTDRVDYAALLCAASGVVMATSTLAHITQILNCSVLFIICVIYNRRKYKHIPIWGYYVMTGFSCAIVVLAGLYRLGGRGLWEGFTNVLQYNYFKIPHLTISDHIKRLMSVLYQLLNIWLPSFFICFSVFFLFFLLRKNKKALLFKSILFALPCATIIFFLSFYKQYGPSLLGRYNTFFSERAALLVFCIVPLYMFFMEHRKKQAQLLVFVLWFPNLISLGSVIISSHSASTSRLYTLYSGALLTVIFAYWAIKDAVIKKSEMQLGHSLLICRLCVIAGTFLSVVGLLITQYGSIYRDETIPYLTEKVNTGIYRGMYTTPARAKAIVALEYDLQKYIDVNKTVLFADLMPAAYMMTTATPFTPTTWDPCMYRYGFQDDMHYQRYFILKDAVPEQVVFINSEEAPLSLDDEGNQFATFVHENYSLYHSSTGGADKLFFYRIYRKNQANI